MVEPGQALPPASREPKDVTFRDMLRLLALIGATLLLLIGVATWLFPQELRDRRFEQPFPAYPTPRLQPSPRADMQAFRAKEMQQLNSAGWQDRAAGVVHIPIEQAMRIVASEGIPGWPAGRADVSLGDRR